MAEQVGIAVQIESLGPVSKMPPDTFPPAPELYDKSGPKPMLSHQGSAARPSASLLSRSYSQLSYFKRMNLMRFGRKKITFLVANSVSTFLALCYALVAGLTLGQTYSYAPVLNLEGPEIRLIPTAAASALALTGFLGFVGAFMHQKRVVASYLVLLWPIFIAWIVSGYYSFKAVETHLFDMNMSSAWDQLGSSRSIVESSLMCCGFYNSLDRSFPNSVCPDFSTFNATDISISSAEAYPGCQDYWLPLVRTFLKVNYIASFVFAADSLVIIVITLLVANHIYD
ncbi:uncharacterized protein BJ171DRAFT_139111 [Polychytrium aggregatum]|uniref:uncharacterized protein n=1 Tax=Polychytrium aggregatum TaxID=110093 RepID=UPI0022FE6B53|nr:uncharacterized protein BJ171DRAFT_139111 [Polychytrium aggregatum]KAI9203700.1 hypothetical protein BJ171DRAFT_139111 [Polychytrium aggregatum]